MKFRTAYSGDSSKFVSDSGSPYLDQYEYEIDKKGVQNLVKTDKQKNVYEAIQADYDSTDINKLMLRFSLGDSSAINIREGFFADVSKMPTTIAEMFDKAQDCEEYFASLPSDFKQLFNNSYTEFFSELNSDEKSVFDKVDQYNDRFIDHSFDEDDFSDDVKESASDE